MRTQDRAPPTSEQLLGALLFLLTGSLLVSLRLA